MYITTTATARRKKAEEFQEISDSISRLSELLTPNPERFSGSRNGRREKPNLFVETVIFDEHGEEMTAWTAPRGVVGTAAMVTHFRAGSSRMPATLPNYDGPPIRAVSLGYEEDDFVGWFSLDLDGGYPIGEIGPVLASVFGKRRLVCHSGSGRKGRHRIFGLLAVPMTVRRLKELLGAICTHLGFPPVDGSLEIYPTYKHSRLPGGLGGCQLFDIETGERIGDPDQVRLCRAIIDSDSIDLDAIAKDVGIDSFGIDTAIPSFRGRFDPFVRRERRRSAPRAVRALIHRGVTRSGERQKIQHAFFLDCLLSGYSLNESVSRFFKYVDDGKFDASADVKRHGREWLKKQAMRIARGIYASTRPIGMPDPIPLDGAELHRIREIAKRVHAEHPEFSEVKVEKFLRKILAIFKGCLAAGLPLARIHSKIWQAAGGTHYARIRAACGIFDARSGYKSMKLVMSRAHLGAQPCEAKAIDWSTSFMFDRDLPAPSYEIASSIFVDAPSPPTSKTSCPVTVASLPTTPIDTPRLHPTAPRVSGGCLRVPQGFTRLYVHHLQDPLEMKGSDTCTKISILHIDTSDSIPMEVDIDYAKIHNQLDDEIRGAKKRRAELKRARSIARNGPEKKAYVPEWRRIAKWLPPVSDEQSLDDWIDSCLKAKELAREYNREKSRATRRRDRHNRDTTMFHWVSIGEVASVRCHELRAIFGLKPWK